MRKAQISFKYSYFQMIEQCTMVAKLYCIGMSHDINMTSGGLYITVAKAIAKVVNRESINSIIPENRMAGPI